MDVTYGPGKRTLMATAAYTVAPKSRENGFQDGIFSTDVKSGAVVAFTPLDKAPATATFVPSTVSILPSPLPPALLPPLPLDLLLLLLLPLWATSPA